MTGRRFYVITGGTFVHVAPHFSLSAPAYGKVGKLITSALQSKLTSKGDEVVLIRTRMALGDSEPSYQERQLNELAGIQCLETNDDLKAVLDALVELPDTRCIVMAAAVCDWAPTSISTMRNPYGTAVKEFGKTVSRLRTDQGDLCVGLRPADKLLRRIREKRKDVFLVGFKATAGFTPEQTYAAGLKLLKQSSANLVLANDVHNYHNMVITPEEYPYHSDNRKSVVKLLAEMIRDRTNLTFVRTELVDTARADPNALATDGAIPQNFCPTLQYVIDQGGFKAFLGKTSGHFGCKVLKPDYVYQRISSIRKVDHNKVFSEGMARIFGYEDGRIQAGGAKPSVGEHTQHQIYERLGEQVHSIMHFHSPLKEGSTVATAPQKPFECGSNECGHNTAENMREMEPGIWAVFLDGHGPNIAFHKDVPVDKVIDFIDRNFDLSDKTGGLV